jgi:hypothetical protein
VTAITQKTIHDRSLRVKDFLYFNSCNPL